MFINNITMFRKTLSGLKNINSSNINNSYDIINHGNLTVSGILQSPFTDLLRYDLNNLTISEYNNHDSQQNLINNLNISSNNINIKLENYNSSLTISQNNINTDLQNHKSLVSVSYSDLIQSDQLLQNEIDAINLLAISSGNVDLDHGISIAIIDSYARIYINNSGISFNSLSVSGANTDLSFQNFKSLTESNITTHTNQIADHENRIDILELDVYDLNITSALHELRLDNIDSEIINHDTRITDLEQFCYGATFDAGITEADVSFIESVQDISDQVQIGFQALQAGQLAYQGYQAIKNGEFDTFIANQLGYNVLNDTENTTQNTAIASNSGIIAGLVTWQVATDIAVGIINNDISNLETSDANQNNQITNIGISVNTNLDNKLNSFIIGTTTNLNSINSNITNLQSTDNSLGTTINSITNRIIINTTGITFKGQTINSVFINDVGMGISGILTVSGTLQSPLTSLLSVSSGIIDGKVGTIIGVSIPQFLTRNETLLPSSFTTGYLNTFQGTDNYILKGGSSSNSYLQFQNNTYGNNKCYTGLISGNLRLYSPVNIDFYTNDGTLNASINSNTMTINNHLTVSGTLQSPLTNLLSISHSNLTSYVYSLNNSALGVSINNETTRTNNLTTSSANTNSQLYSFNSTLTTADANLGTSISNVNSKASTIIGVSLPQILSRNETLLPSTFINSNLNKLGTSAVVGKTSMNQNYNFQVGSDNHTLSNPSDTKIVISTGGENKNAYLYLSTPNNPSDNLRAMKTAIITQGLSAYSRGKLHFCLNNQLDNNENTGNATLNDSLLSLHPDGNLTITGNTLFQSDLTVSGTLQSPLTSLLSVSSGIIDGKIGILGISHLNLTSYTYSLNNSTLGISINNNTNEINTNKIDIINNFNSIQLLDTDILTLGSSSSVIDGKVGTIIGVSIPNIDSKVGTLIGISMPQFLTKNQTVLPSTFTSSSLTSLGTLSRLGLNKTNTSGNINLMIKGLTSGAGSIFLCPNIDNTENSIYFHPSSQATGYDSGATGSWLIGSNINGGDSNTFSVWNPNLQLKQMRMKTGGDTEIYKTGIINSQAENAHSYLYLSNSNGADSALKTMIMSEAQSSWSRGKLHFCLNNDATTNSTTKNASLADSRMSLDYNSNLSVSGNISIGNNNNTYKLDVSGDSILRGTLDTTGRIDASGNNIMRGADALQLTHSGNCSFKITGGSYTYRYETQTDDEHYLFDGANNEVYHISSDNQIWFQSDVNCAGTFFDSGIPLTPSSRRLKTNIKNLNEIENLPKLIDKIDFKKYSKTYKNKTYDEIGVVIEELEEIDGIEKYNLIHTREGGGEYDGLKYLKYVPFFMILINELKEKVEKLENNK